MFPSAFSNNVAPAPVGKTSALPISLGVRSEVTTPPFTTLDARPVTAVGILNPDFGLFPPILKSKSSADSLVGPLVVAGAPPVEVTAGG